ncbi:uncharacterized protein LACBIDRAFT_328936, partial [Laccaria bicolor S238N-H82]
IPQTIDEWRKIYDDEDEGLTAYSDVWFQFKELFEQAGFRLWRKRSCLILAPPLEDEVTPGPSGYAYWSFLNPSLAATQWEIFNVMNGRLFALRHIDGRDFVVRVITARGEGHDHLRIIRKLSTKSNLVLSNNHILPMEYEILYEDVLLGIYPMLGWNRRLAMTSLFANSVEDIMYLILQALEDVFLNNFLVEWVPHTLIAGSTRRPTTRPRVYPTDSEFAVDFPADSLPEDRLLTDFPVSFDNYLKKNYPTVLFVWTFGNWERDLPFLRYPPTFIQCGSDTEGRPKFAQQSSILEIDDILQSLRNADPAKRPTAIEALDKLDHVMKGLPPSSLHHPTAIVIAESLWFVETTYHRYMVIRTHAERQAGFLPTSRRRSKEVKLGPLRLSEISPMLNHVKWRRVNFLDES